MDTQLPVMVIDDYRRTKRKTTSLIPQFPDSSSFVGSDYISILCQRLGLGLGLGYMYLKICCTHNNYRPAIKFPLVMEFRTQCIPAELAWSGATDGLE